MMHAVGGQKKLKTSVSKLSFCNYNDACVFVKGTSIINGTGANVAANGTCKNIAFKNAASLIICIKKKTAGKPIMQKMLMLRC